MELIPNGGISGLSGIAGGGAPPAPATYDYVPTFTDGYEVVIRVNVESTTLNVEAVAGGGSAHPYGYVGGAGGGGEYLKGLALPVSLNDTFNLSPGRFVGTTGWLIPRYGGNASDNTGGTGGGKTALTSSETLGFDSYVQHAGGDGGSVPGGSGTTSCSGAGGGEAGQPTRAGADGSNSVVGTTAAGGAGGTSSGSVNYGATGQSIASNVPTGSGSPAGRGGGGGGSARGGSGGATVSPGIGTIRVYGDGTQPFDCFVDWSASVEDGVYNHLTLYFNCAVELVSQPTIYNSGSQVLTSEWTQEGPNSIGAYFDSDFTGAEEITIEENTEAIRTVTDGYLPFPKTAWVNIP